MIRLVLIAALLAWIAVEHHRINALEHAIDGAIAASVQE